MSKCGLCGKELGEGEGFGSFGLLPPSESVCGSCNDDLQALYFSDPDSEDYRVARKRFVEKHGSRANAILSKTDPIPSGNSPESVSAASRSGLYSNAGGTMIILAKVIFAVFSIISVIVGIAVGSASYDFQFLPFLLISVVGVLVAYLAGLGFAAFGHLVCDVKYIKDELSKKK